MKFVSGKRLNKSKKKGENMIGFIIGIIVGSFLGVSFMALATASKNSDRYMETHSHT